MFKNLAREIELVGRDKGISKEILINALEVALLTAARKVYGSHRDIEAHYNEENGEIELFEFKTVVETVYNDALEITPEAGKEHDPEAEIGDSIGIKMDASELGRIAAQAAKQVIIQKVRDAEREIVYGEYIDRKGELVAGIVRRLEGRDVIIDLGKTEAILPDSEQVPREHYRAGDRVQAYVVDVLKSSRRPQIVVSRTHAGLLTKLFANEVPEIYEGIVSIESAAREPGGRAKIAVASKDSDVDPVGACVGMKGARVQSVVQELRGEKIDIVPFDPDPAKYVCNAIAPAEVSRVIMDEGNKAMELIVPDDQLSLAIGRKGQNVRLAAKLTGWKIDIQGETKVKEMQALSKQKLMSIEGVGEPTAELLYRQGITEIQQLIDTESDNLVQLTGMEAERIEEIKDSARAYLANASSEEEQAVAADDKKDEEAAKEEKVEAKGDEPEANEREEVKAEAATEEEKPAEQEAATEEPATEESSEEVAAQQDEPSESDEVKADG